MPLLWCMMIYDCRNKVKRHTVRSITEKRRAAWYFNARTRAFNFVKTLINPYKSKLKNINNFVISTLIMGINSYSEVTGFGSSTLLIFSWSTAADDERAR